MKLDATILGVVQRRDAVDVRKLSSQIGSGQMVETVDGRRFRVTSKIANAGGISFCLTNPAGSIHVTAAELADLDPLPSGIARLAHVLRILSYNRDFTEYINTAIESHGLPIDPAMDWSKWLYKFAAKYLTSERNVQEDTLDETLHEFIIKLIYQKDILSSYDPKKVTEERSKGKGPAGKVTAYLTQMFTNYRSIALRTLSDIETVVPGEYTKTDKSHSGLRKKLDTPMVQPGIRDKGEEGEINILDTREHARQPQQEEVESWEDISRFRAEYGDWLTRTHESADVIIKLFDLIVDAETETGGGLSSTSDYKQEWMDSTGKSSSRFQQVSAELSETLQKFITRHPELSETSLIARLIGDIKSKKQTTKSKVVEPKSVLRAASLNLVAAAPSELAQIPGDPGRIPHDNTGNTSNAVILLDEKPPEQPRTVAPEISAVIHGF
jgi:hypothetical protein